jgi:hypothetical protein
MKALRMAPYPAMGERNNLSYLTLDLTTHNFTTVRRVEALRFKGAC